MLESSNAEGDYDASPKGGKPGFIKVLDDRTLLIPDIGGNRLFQCYQNSESNPKAGLIFMIPDISDRFGFHDADANKSLKDLMAASESNAAPS